MKKKLFSTVVVLVVILILGLTVSCSVQAQPNNSGKNNAIQEVKDALTVDVSGSWEAVEYEDGYVVRLDDMAFWYVKGGTVYSLNGFAKTYAENTDYEYGIPWEDLFE